MKPFPFPEVRDLKLVGFKWNHCKSKIKMMLILPTVLGLKNFLMKNWTGILWTVVDQTVHRKLRLVGGVIVAAFL